MSKEIIYGQSARGKTCIVLGSTVYALHNYCSDWWDKQIISGTPKQPAWTQMNKDWKKKY